MSAFMVSRAHIDRMVALACYGPNDQGAIAPDRAWTALHWWADDPRKPGREASDHNDYFRRLHEIERRATSDTADAVGAMLISANIRSLEARYPDTIGHPENRPGEIDQSWTVGYTFPVTTERIRTAEGLNALSCYEYQACESDDWRDSEAQDFCDSLRKALCSVLTRDTERGWDDWDRKARTA